MDKERDSDEDKNSKTPLPVTVFYKAKPNVIHEILSDASDSEIISSVRKVNPKKRGQKRVYNEESTDSEYQVSNSSSESDSCVNYCTPKRPKRSSKKVRNLIRDNIVHQSNEGEKRDSKTGESGDIHLRGSQNEKGSQIVDSGSKTGESGDILFRGSQNEKVSQIVGSGSKTGESGDIHLRGSQNNEVCQIENIDTTNNRSKISYNALLISNSINFLPDSSSSDSDKETPYRKKKARKRFRNEN